MCDLQQRRLELTTALLAGVRLDIPAQYVNMKGTGEFWVGVDGLPLRQTLNLEFPLKRDSYVKAEITANFGDGPTGVHRVHGQPQGVSSLVGCRARSPTTNVVACSVCCSWQPFWR
jgi:hypothetical protein